MSTFRNGGERLLIISIQIVAAPERKTRSSHNEERPKERAHDENLRESGENIGAEKLRHVGVSGDVPHQGRNGSFFVNRITQFFVLGVEQWQDSEQHQQLHGTARHVAPCQPPSFPGVHVGTINSKQASAALPVLKRIHRMTPKPDAATAFNRPCIGGVSFRSSRLLPLNLWY